MTIASFDRLETEKKKELLHNCCGSELWVSKMLALFPFEDLVDVLEGAEHAWYECDENAWLDAFDHHPKIGDLKSIEDRYASTAQFATEEQAGVATASEKELNEFSLLNTMYEKSFGFIFIVCATGRSTAKLLQMIQQRVSNDRQTELKIAAGEQIKITKLRLQKLFI